MLFKWIFFFLNVGISVYICMVIQKSTAYTEPSICVPSNRRKGREKLKTSHHIWRWVMCLCSVKIYTLAYFYLHHLEAHNSTKHFEIILEINNSVQQDNWEGILKLPGAIQHKKLRITLLPCYVHYHSNYLTTVVVK